MAMHGAAGPSKGKVKLREEWRWHSCAPSGIGEAKRRNAQQRRGVAMLGKGNDSQRFETLRNEIKRRIHNENKSCSRGND